MRYLHDEGDEEHDVDQEGRRYRQTTHVIVQRQVVVQYEIATVPPEIEVCALCLCA